MKEMNLILRLLYFMLNFSGCTKTIIISLIAKPINYFAGGR